MNAPIRHCATIAGTDPSGGAGIQADIKTFSALGVFATSVITAVVDQNTCGVRSVHHLPDRFVADQIDSLFSDVRIDAVKIGMLDSASMVRTVADGIRRHRPPWLVLDPVMVAKSGDRLLSEDAVAAVRDELIPLADVITPNLHEAADLLGERPALDEAEMADQLPRLAELGANVLLKGGHLTGPSSPDLLWVDGATQRFVTERVATRNTHGTGCTLSAAIAALRCHRPDWVSAVTDAKAYVTGAIRAADTLTVGQGNGPLHHFHAWWP